MGNEVPWRSLGRVTPISELANSIVAVGNGSRDKESVGQLIVGHPEKMAGLIDTMVVGTAFRAGPGKYLTCRHVVSALDIKGGKAHVLLVENSEGANTVIKQQINMSIGFVDPRHKRNNEKVDVAALVASPPGTNNISLIEREIQWGDSSQAGVGDRVVLGGYPLGDQLFYALGTNRGLFRPALSEGIISAIIPAITEHETRLFQISVLTAGGISGGVVCEASTGKVIGMVTSGLTNQESGQELPFTYAVPNEVLQPFVDTVSYKDERGARWQ